MEIVFKDKALRDLDFWKSSGQNHIKTKISEIIVDISMHPTTGIGKPEELKYELSGFWSRRINKEHRIIYEFTDTTIYIHSLKGHY